MTNGIGFHGQPDEQKLSANSDAVCGKSRRDFLKSAAALGTITLAPGVTLYLLGGEAEAAASPSVRWGLLIDASKCTDDCKACIDACSAAYGWKNNGHPETDPQWIRKVSVKNPKNGATFSTPVMCQHCANPPCVDVCPTGASFKRVDGIVLVDKHICIGCRYCIMACPYNARAFVHEPLEDQKTDAPRGKGTVESCTLCVKRVDNGGTPHCVEACNSEGHGAMLFGDLNDPNSEIAKRVAAYRTTQLRADLGCDPGIYYLNVS
jgi:molybdopterin-containing oxidoreductase family iron-sulfur binding subunit